MNDKRKTNELKEYIGTLLLKASKIMDEGISLIETRYSNPKKNNWDDVFAYFSKGEYQYKEYERGKLSLHRKTKEIDEIAYWILDIKILNYASNYEARNRRTNEDSRRQWFGLELDIHKAFGEYFYNRAKSKIDKILKEYPYED